MREGSGRAAAALERRRAGGGGARAREGDARRDGDRGRSRRVSDDHPARRAVDRAGSGADRRRRACFPADRPQGLNLGLRDAPRSATLAGARDGGWTSAARRRSRATPPRAGRTLRCERPASPRSTVRCCRPVAGRCRARIRTGCARRRPATAAAAMREGLSLFWRASGFSPRDELAQGGDSRKCSRAGCAGKPNQRWPAGTSFITPEAAPICAPAPMWRWPASPTWPPRATKSSITQEPETPDLGDDHAMAADDDVVADLHEIIDLRALADDRVAIGAAVDGRAGADLDVVLDDDAADLRHLEVAARAHARSRSRPGRYARRHG